MKERVEQAEREDEDLTAGDGLRAGRREWIGLAVLALPTLLVSFDTFVLLLALPHLSAELGAGSTQQLWIMDIYGFMLAGFLITMGTLGDRIGRRKLLLIGAAAFGAASVLAAYSSSPQMLIAARALLGVAGATLTPSTLSLISTMFNDAKQRAVAIGLWAGCFTVGAIIGPIVGGAMLELFWWGSVFLIGVPAMLLLLVVGPILLPEYRDERAGRLDLTSVAVSLAAILPLVYGLKELAAYGWQPWPVAAVVVGVVFSVVFVRRQRKLSDPLLDLSLFATRSFSTALGSMLSYSLVGGAIMLFITQYFQSVAGLSPLQAGLGLLPGMAAATVSITMTPIVARRIRPAYLIASGLVGMVASLLVIAQVDADSGAAVLVVSFAVFSFCGGPLVALGTNLIIGSAPPEKAGSAGAMSQISNEFGAALGIATVGTVGTVVYRAQIAETIPADVSKEVASAAQESVAGAVAAAGDLPNQVAGTLVTSAGEAFASGLSTIATISAAIMFCIAILIVTTLRHVKPIGAEEPAPVAEDAASGTADGSSAATPEEARD